MQNESKYFFSQHVTWARNLGSPAKSCVRKQFDLGGVTVRLGPSIIDGGLKNFLRVHRPTIEARKTFCGSIDNRWRLKKLFAGPSSDDRGSEIFLRVHRPTMEAWKSFCGSIVRRWRLGNLFAGPSSDDGGFWNYFEAIRFGAVQNGSLTPQSNCFRTQGFAGESKSVLYSLRFQSRNRIKAIPFFPFMRARENNYGDKNKNKNKKETESLVTFAREEGKNSPNPTSVSISMNSL